VVWHQTQRKNSSPSKEYNFVEAHKTPQMASLGRNEVLIYSKTNILKLLKIIGRLGKAKTQSSRFQQQDKRSPYLKSHPDTYFAYAIQSIISEEGLYND